MLGTPVEVPLIVVPSGSIAKSKSAFLLIYICAFCNSGLVMFAKVFNFLGLIPNSLPVVSGTKFFNFLNVKFLTSSFGNCFFIVSLTLLLTFNLSAKTIFLGCGFALVSVVTSSAAISTFSVTSSVNSSPKTRLEASIALLGSMLLIKPANGATFSPSFCCFLT